MEKKIKIYAFIILGVLILTALLYFHFYLPISQPKENDGIAELKAEEINHEQNVQANGKEAEWPSIEEEKLDNSQEEKKKTDDKEQDSGETVIENNWQIEIKEFNSDKDTYGSREKVIFSLLILSDHKIDRAELSISGIRPYQYAYINKLEEINLARGQNMISIEAETPICTSGCGGVGPGPYDITADILVNHEIIASQTIIINLIENN